MPRLPIRPQWELHTGLLRGSCRHIPPVTGQRLTGIRQLDVTGVTRNERTSEKDEMLPLLLVSLSAHSPISAFAINLRSIDIISTVNCPSLDPIPHLRTGRYEHLHLHPPQVYE